MKVKDTPQVKLAELQKKIQYLLNIDPANLIFEYRKTSTGYELVVSTINPVHRQSFLFHKTEGKTKTEAIEKMMEYVRTDQKVENSFTIQWSLIKKDELHTSYVRAENILNAIEKIMYGRDRNSIIIFSASLNSIA